MKRVGVHAIYLAAVFLMGSFIGVYMRAALPVVIWMHPVNWQVGQNYVLATVEGYKLNDCVRIAGSEVGYVRFANSAWEESGFSYVNDRTPNNSKPTGYFSFGYWGWNANDPMLAAKWVTSGRPDSVMMTIKHQCGPDIVETKIGPFKVPTP